MKQIRVLVVEDQRLLRETLQQALELEREMVVVGSAANGREAVALARKLCPDVVLMDLKMPEMDGISATRRIKQLQPKTRVIMLTVFGDDEYVHHAIIAGADGYLLKDVGWQAVADAVRRVAAGDCLIDATLMRAVLDQYARMGKRQQSASPYPDGLTEREVEVLRLVAEGCSNQEIAERLTLSLATVKTHLYNACQKIGARDRTQAALYTVHKGI